MINGLWGKKIGMTEIFQDDLALPVTVVDTSGWFILQIKTLENDGYNAIKVGCLKSRHRKDGFKDEHLKKTRTFFEFVRELRVSEVTSELKAGVEVNLENVVFESGEKVDVIGTTKGAGFAGVVKRHNFKGGRASHGGKSTLRAPGSIGFMCSTGKVIKGKRMAGHMGASRKTVKSLKIIKIDSDSKAILVKGSIPGKSGSLVFVRKYT
jgi:large subunit ribosomal protein L3